MLKEERGGRESACERVRTVYCQKGGEGECRSSLDGDVADLEVNVVGGHRDGWQSNLHLGVARVYAERTAGCELRRKAEAAGTVLDFSLAAQQDLQAINISRTPISSRKVHPDLISATVEHSCCRFPRASVTHSSVGAGQREREGSN